MAELMRFVYFALLGGLAVACAPRLSNSPRGFWHTNRLNHHGDPIGRWNVYYDDARTKPLTQGRYRRGQPAGRWRYYDPTGVLARQEHYHRYGISGLTYYHPNGQIARQGQARMVDEPGGLHFYWFGEWLSYSEAGALQKIETYQNGLLVNTQRIQNL
jgi:antitoxin component YwqK of YwqJK toxin-antitoxin module